MARLCMWKMCNYLKVVEQNVIFFKNNCYEHRHHGITWLVFISQSEKYVGRSMHTLEIDSHEQRNLIYGNHGIVKLAFRMLFKLKLLTAVQISYDR